MLTIEAITAALPTGVGAPSVEHAVTTRATTTEDGAPVTLVALTYPSAGAHAARVSADVEALRSLPGLVCVESWSAASAPLIVHLRFAPAPAVEAPRPIAPAPVPASAHRRR